MHNLNIEQNNEVLKNTSDSIIEFLYNLSKGLDSNVPQYMKGRLEIPHGYADAIDFLTSKFQDLYINSSQGAYIRFKDDTIQSKLANAYGDGIGLTTQQAASINAVNAMGNLFRGNTTITSFDELSSSLFSSSEFSFKFIEVSFSFSFSLLDDFILIFIFLIILIN